MALPTIDRDARRRRRSSRHCPLSEESWAMRAMRAETFSGYAGLKLVDLPKPSAANGRVLVRMSAAGVTPLDHSILSGGHPRPKPPLVLGGEGAGTVVEPSASHFPVGARVMFAGPYGFLEAGTWQE